VLANKKSPVYRYAECKNYNAKLTPKNVVRIDTVEDAVEAGYHPANDCPAILRRVDRDDKIYVLMASLA
jgi:hypothetical protein